MELNKLTPRLALNKAYLKVKAQRTEIELFKTNLISLLDNINKSESEEFHKNLVSKFLTDTYYGSTHFINTKGRNDLVIHNTNSASGTVGVILEAKSPSNKAEMLKTDNINNKAFQELILYFLRERITLKNHDIKHLVVTNIYEWFIFDANLFEEEFAQNKNLVNKFNDFEDKRLSGKKTDFFYKDIAQPEIEKIKHKISFTHFDIRDYDKALRNNDKKDDTSLIALFKLLSPEHLLKLQFANDSNSLDKSFYSELLHIIGLTETKDGSKKLIQRKKEGEQNSGSLLENTIIQLESHDKISRVTNLTQYGETYNDQLFNIALELVITWMNRILFLKLLEAQLLSYHKGDKRFNFLNIEKIRDFDDLDKLFFRVLAKRVSERDATINKLFELVPYLNSSLFEPTELEHQTIFINGLEDFVELPLLTTTVIKDNNGKKLNGNLSTLQYLFSFLEAYDFTSEGKEEIQEENKRLINASVLGLIFEKINGYKDGSFFTPGFITMYMCKETIRRAVVQKFNEAKGWSCADLKQLFDKIDDKKEANNIINSLKICDPAVGSGHFLVSALNEIIAIKSELKILIDKESKTLRDYHFEVVNDELIVTVDDGKLFEYIPKNKESQNVQETIFHEKQTIIENCLFGVDLNPNSVKICRLRLWIELLKNAYYKSPNYSELETLPNIDINIKCGNSLISRFDLKDNHKTLPSAVQQKMRLATNKYKEQVIIYKSTSDKKTKQNAEKEIERIKEEFSQIANPIDKDFIEIKKLKAEMGQMPMFFSREDQEDWKTRLELKALILKKIEDKFELKTKTLYKNAFEWRFEFPEVLNNEGEFIGFDVVIGNPPYIISRETFSESYKDFLYANYSLIHEKPNLFLIFIERGFNILKRDGKFSFIIPNSWTGMESASKIREHLLKKSKIIRILNLLGETFEDVNVEASILVLDRNIDSIEKTKYGGGIGKTTNFDSLSEIEQSNWLNNRNCIIDITSSNIESVLIDKIKANSLPLENFYSVKVGLQAYEQGKGNPKQSPEDVKNHVFDYSYKFDETTYQYLGGADVKRYSIVWSGQWLKYGQWLSQPKTLIQFSEPRILIREITSKFPYVIEACYNDEIYLNNKSILNILANTKDFDLFSLLGYLNSKLISFYHIRQTVKGNRNLFPKLVIKDLKNYPIIANEIFLKISPLAKEIYEYKKANPKNDTTKLEAEIDQLVYQLYGLTKDEIKIVEGL